MTRLESTVASPGTCASQVYRTRGKNRRTTAEDRLVERLREHIIPLEGTDPGTGLADLRPVADILGGKSVVGLGEAIDGTKEYFQLKHRLVRLLVTEMNFRLFGLEANFSETFAVNDSIVSGDPEDTLDGLHFWTWNTEETLEASSLARSPPNGRPHRPPRRTQTDGDE